MEMMEREKERERGAEQLCRISLQIFVAVYLA